MKCSPTILCPPIRELEEAEEDPGVLQRGVLLRLIADQEGKYLLGQPFRVNVVLEPDGDDGRREPVWILNAGDRDPQSEPRREVGLDPRLGFLRIWFRIGDQRQKWQPMGIRMLAEADLVPTRLTEGLRRTGYNVWYSVPLRMPDGDVVESVEVIATYTGFVGDPSRLPEADRRKPTGKIAVSNSVVIKLVEPTAVEDRRSFHLISKPASRDFLLNLGGDRGSARADLREISDTFPLSAYAKYADFALAADLATPSYSYDRATRRLIETPAQPDRAWDYLDKAESNLVPLPESFRESVERLRSVLTPLITPP